MAVVTYKCTVCEREINLVQNKQGLDWIGDCNMTLGCRGVLQQQEVHLDYVRGTLPPDVVGLKNWVQRQILFNYEQTVGRLNWVINHDMGIQPSVIVYVNVQNSDGTTSQVLTTPEQIVYNTDDQVTLIFATEESGIAQLIGRYSNPDILNPRPQPALPTPLPTIQLTSDVTINGNLIQGTLTIATRLSTVGNIAFLPVALTYTAPNGTTATVTYPADSTPSDASPWSDTSQIYFQGKVYTVRTLNIETATVNITNGSGVTLTGISPNGALILPILSANFVTNAFVIASDYTLYFLPNSTFQITNTNIFYNLTWTVASSTYDPISNETSIVVQETIPPPYSFPAGQGKILQSGSREITPGEVLILLGSSPYTIYDQLTTSYIDFADATQFEIFYNAGDLFADTSLQQTIYPPIVSV